MPLPPALFLRADEAAKELGVNFDRLASFSMNNLLAVSVLLARQDPILGHRELNSSSTSSSIRQLQIILTGVFDLRPEDAFVTLIRGEAVISYVSDGKNNTNIRITSPAAGFPVSRGDLVIRTEEYERFKQTHLAAETKRAAGPGRPSIHAWDLCFAELRERCGPSGLSRDPRALRKMVREWFDQYPGSETRIPDDGQISRKVKHYLASMETDTTPDVPQRSMPIVIKRKTRRR